MRKWLAIGAVGVLALGVTACGSDDSDDSKSSAGGGGGGGDLSGSIKIDGSSTVGPFAQAAAEAFQGENPNVKVSVGTSGTGGGFEKFCAGETDISDASRPIKDDEEVPLCKKGGITYKEIQVANDGIAVVTNTATKIDCMTTDELKKLWNQGSKVKAYNEINPKFPDTKASLFGPGTDSGTFDFFTDEINGEEGVSRKEYQPSEDDNILVQGVSGSEGGLGYFGFSYYEQNADKLNLVGVGESAGSCVKPTKESIQDGSYTPLSRPLFMYPSQKALQRPEVKAFMDYVVANYQTIAEAAQIVPMTEEQAAGYIAKRHDGWRAGSTLAFGIFDASDRLLGSVSLLEIHRYELEAEVGYWVARQARGHGVAARAVELIARFAADLGLARLTATVEISNVASQRVLERAGFTREELVPKNRQLHGQWIDEYLYTRAI